MRFAPWPHLLGVLLAASTIACIGKVPGGAVANPTDSSAEPMDIGPQKPPQEANKDENSGEHSNEDLGEQLHAPIPTCDSIIATTAEGQRSLFSNDSINKWQSALKDYQPFTKRTSPYDVSWRVPMARYLNAMHRRLHATFAHCFLAQLEELPPHHPINSKKLKAVVEIVLRGEDGSIIHLGLVETSALTDFDIGTLESIRCAAPFPAAPKKTWSSDGNVYVHWELHRKRIYACSTYFARPFVYRTSSSPEETVPH